MTKDTDNLLIVDLLQSRAISTPHYNCFTFPALNGEENLNFVELDNGARRIAAYLQMKNAESERVLLLFEPDKHYIFSLYGCMYAKAIAVPAYPPLTQEMANRLIQTIDDAGVKFVLTTKSIMTRLNKFKFFAPFASIIKKITPEKYGTHAALLESVGALNKAEIICADEIPQQFCGYYKQTTINTNDIAYLQYTSGSTSQPKGVIITHDKLIANLMQLKEVIHLNETDTYMNWLPPYHDMGLISGIIVPIHAPYKTVNIAPFEFLKNPFQWLKYIKQYKATIIGCPDFAYRYCVNKISETQIAELDLSSLRIAYSAGEKIHADTINKFYDKFKLCGFKENIYFPCYGLAEAILFVSGKSKPVKELANTFDNDALSQRRAMPVKKHHSRAKLLVSVGCTHNNSMIKIIDPETFEELSEGQIGEIWYAGPNVTIGYWNQPKKSNEIMKAKHPNYPDALFLRTGDLGFLHEGELYISSRVKDLIIIAGKNYYPQDIENDIEMNNEYLRPGCIAAFSIEENYQEHLVIIAEIKEKANRKDTKENLQHIIDQVKSTVVLHHSIAIKEVVLLKPRTIPKTTSGKLKRSACKALFLANKFKERALNNYYN